MEHKTYIPSSQYIHKPLDGRRLTLSLYFYCFSSQQIEDFRNALLQWIYDFTGTDFIFQWFCDGKNVSQKQILDWSHRKLSLTKDCSTAFDAYVISPIIHNTATLRKFQRYIGTINPAYAFGWNIDTLLGGSSIDYPSYINEKIPINSSARNDIAQSVYRSFCESNRKLLSLHNQADLRGAFSAKAYSSHPNLYYGKANVSFSAFCIGGFIDEMAENFSLFAQQLAAQFVHVNAHVFLQPTRSGDSPYMRYFGKNLIEDGSHEDANCTGDEWYPTYYMRGVEWLNILSPLAKQHISATQENIQRNHEVSIQSITGGSILVRATKPITEYSRDTALHLKKIILPALYPGKSSVPLRRLFPRQGEKRIYDWCPCNDWAIIPIEENEIEIIGTDLAYISANSLIR